MYCCGNTPLRLRLHHCQTSSTPWKPLFSSNPPLSSAQLLAFPSSIYKPSFSSTHHLLIYSSATKSHSNDKFGEEDDGNSNEKAAKGSGTTARARRLLRIREEKRKREFDRLHNYPAWAKVLEDACKNDEELRSVLGDSIGNPELMKKRDQMSKKQIGTNRRVGDLYVVEERVRKKGRDFRKSKTGSVLAFKVSFRDFNPVDSYIWFELYGSPSDRDVDLLGSVIQSWYAMGRLGAFNSSNLQLANAAMVQYPLYDADKGFKVMPSSFHDISDVEFQDNWGRVWVDLGTSDFFAIDVLLNCLTLLSSEYLGIQQVVFGGRRMGDWEEGMTSPDYGYKYFKI
ncbi:uncharacterized protein LOC114319960 isoform X1 [Camellia sinensis]|uniref:uncharacterized protein LOC114319960 isoform X1 n=1 Tax=Camellia sinensis TaxID=4442 RepID=UPI00103630F3|nr:uncharacterized protein LOC114319960 isoform X1 [Camellia sinensis]